MIEALITLIAWLAVCGYLAACAGYERWLTLREWWEATHG